MATRTSALRSCGLPFTMNQSSPAQSLKRASYSTLLIAVLLSSGLSSKFTSMKDRMTNMIMCIHEQVLYDLFRCGGFSDHLCPSS